MAAATFQPRHHGYGHAVRAGQRTLVALMPQTLLVVHGKPDR